MLPARLLHTFGALSEIDPFAGSVLTTGHEQEWIVNECSDLIAGFVAVTTKAVLAVDCF
jgi:hypothetical protein